ncbi:MAG: hypothetical protein JO020_10345, partial [Chloroflexi bacterium]|nr:hypothetical protein [Chloroflexota bacterium]
MNRLRAIVVCATLVIALMPLAAFADNSTSHDQAELANGQAQLIQAQQQVSDMQAEAQQSAANERTIALLKSEALRQMQLNNVANGNALQQIASALADAARANGDLNAQNELLIAQAKAAILVANADANVANAQMLAQNKGRNDELQNALAQSQLLHQAADYITNTLAAANMANAKQIGDDQADAIAAPAEAQQQNSEAMGANELLASDAALDAGALAATSASITEDAVENETLAHAEESLANDEAMLADAT